MHRSFLRHACLCLSILLILPLAATAQAPVGIISGVVIVGATITVTSLSTGSTRTTQINVNSPAGRNPADILNTTFVSLVIGNHNGKRIPGTPDNSHRNTRISFYADDVWLLRSNFTLSMGVRYEVDTHPLNNDLSKPTLVGPILQT